MGKQNDVQLSSQTGHGWSLPKTVCRLRCSSLPCWRTRSSFPETHRQHGGLVITSPWAGDPGGRNSPCARPCPCRSQRRWSGETFHRAPETPSSRCSQHSFKIRERNAQWKMTKRAVLFSFNRVPFRWSLTSSWCVFQFQWSLWSPVYARLGGRTDAVPPEHLEEEYDEIKI